MAKQEVGKQLSTKSEILSRKDVAALFNVSLPTVHDWVQTGVLKAYRLGTRVFFKRHDIDRAMTEIVPKRNKEARNE